MGKRHNRKRTRSRPRHRDGGNAQIKIQHTRSDSMATTSSVSTSNSYSSSSSSFQQLRQYPIVTSALNADHWQQTYLAWQDRLRIDQERGQEVEMQRLRIFGGIPGDETSLLEPMLKVVTDLFDGFTDYEDP